MGFTGWDEEKRSDGMPSDYFKLMLRHPLKAIRNERELRAAYKVLDPLSVIDEEKLTEGEGDYLLALTDLIWVYEQQQLNSVAGR